MAKKRIDRLDLMAAQTRSDILVAARRLFAQRGYAATSINDIADEAGVAVQTIYARLDNKRGIVLALQELIEHDAGVAKTAAAIPAAQNPREALQAGIRVVRGFPEHCGDIIYTLMAAAVVEPDLAAAVAEGQRRHRAGARLTIDRIIELDGLRDDLPAADAAALLSAGTWHHVWAELVDERGLSWNRAEDRLTDALARALLKEP